MADTPLILQVPRGSAVDIELAANGLPSLGTGAAVLEDLPADEEGALEAPDAGQVVLSLPSPEALEREADTVRRVIEEAGTGDAPLVVEVEVAEHLREDELAAVIEAAARAPRPVILRIMRDG
jgi:hypothetical protein